MVVVPSAILPIIASRWLMDLSPGIVICPSIRSAGWTSIWPRLACHIDFIKSLMLLEVMPLKQPRSFELTVPSRLEEMTAVHALVEDAIREYQLSDDLAHWIELTVSESMINAIQHGNKSDPAKTATLKISSDGNEIEVIVDDQGK